MFYPALFASFLSGFIGVHTNTFETFYNELSAEERVVLSENSIDSFEELYGFLNDRSYDPTNYQHGDSLERSEIYTYLNNYYSSYNWYVTPKNVYDLSKVSGSFPVNIGGSIFTNNDVTTAVNNLYATSNYGGCGPRAAMGVFDYLARTLHYYEFEANPNSSSDRIALAEDVFQHSNVWNDPFSDQIGMTNVSYTNCINGVINSHNLSNIFSTTRSLSLFGGMKNAFLSTITNNISNGLPTTFASYNPNNGGGFRNHFSNIVGLYTFEGIHKETGEHFEKVFVEGLINPTGLYPNDTRYYFDSDFLDNAFLCLFSYSINYEETYNTTASTYSSFVNNNGQGQYFYYEKYGTIYQDSYHSINHKRLRCSYILNQYLVLSPKRIDAGQSYLMLRPNTIWSHHLDFSAALWSDFEDEAYEDFYIEYLNNSGEWIQLLEYNLNQFSQSKDLLKDYHVLFPRDSRAVRFVATHDFPEGTYNRGRIVLDNITIKGRG